MSNPYGKSEIEFFVLCHTQSTEYQRYQREFLEDNITGYHYALQSRFLKIKPRKALTIKGEIDKFDYSNFKICIYQNKS